ncbi:MAG: CRTAC1 family protein [Celeribacter sp.]|jgi:hypothetical protein
MRPEGLSLLLAMLAGAVSAEPLVPVFEDRSAGLTHTYTGGWEHFVGGGVAAFDCDGDALPELYAAGGSAPATLLRNRTEARGGVLRYEPDTPQSLAMTGVTGAWPLDIDSDGSVDLAVLRVGANALLRGDGACGFAPFNNLHLADENRWSTAFSATWERAAQLPTLAIGNYVDRDDPKGPFETCDNNRLYRPTSTGYAAPQILQPGFCALSFLFTDWARQGRADLRISNDRHYYVRGGEEQLWAMEDKPRLFTQADGWASYVIWGMGIASRDLDGDGLAEVYLTSMGDQKLQSLVSITAPAYRDATFERGTTAHRPYFGDDGRPSTGWHVAFGDVQNDGRDDIFVAKGNVDQMPGNAMEDPNNLLLQKADGSFVEQGMAAGIGTVARARGAALADLNLDGQLDLAVINRRATMEIWENTGPAPGHWLQLRLSQPAPNPDAIGAFIEVEAGETRYTRELTVGGGHGGGSLLPEHFGLGPAAQVRLRVIWPDGVTSEWVRTGTDRLLRVTRDGTALQLAPY